MVEPLLNIKLYYRAIEVYDGSFKGSMSPMFDMGVYEFKDLNTGGITPEEFFMNDYTEEINGQEQVGTYTKQLCVIVDARYKISYLDMVMENQFQHMTKVQPN